MQGSSPRATDWASSRRVGLGLRAALMIALSGWMISGSEALARPLDPRTQESVACVQSLLAQAGLDPGAVDGKIGPRTDRALAAWAKAQGSASPANLSPSSAAHWCLRLGTGPTGGRDLWPVLRDMPYSGFRRWADVTVSSDLAGREEATILAGLDRIYSQITQQLGVQTAGVDQIVVGLSAAELHRMTTARISYEIEGLQATLTDRCGKTHEMVGGAAPGIAYVCLRQPRSLTLDHPGRALRFLLAHEVMHLVQFQVAGPLPRGDARQGNRPARVPMWFVEGLAEVMGYRVTWPADPDGMLRRMRAIYRGQPLPDMRSLEDRAALRHRQEHVYNAGALAVGLMVEARGTAAIGRILIAMGEGKSLAEAYQHEFGETLEAFYKDFARRSQTGLAPARNVGLGTNAPQATVPAQASRPKTQPQADQNN